MNIPTNHLPAASGVYKIMHVGTDDVYIGQSRNIARRAKRHVSGIASSCHPNKRIMSLSAAYGFLGFRFFVVEQCDESFLAEREAYWIAVLKPTLNTHAGHRPSTCTVVDIDENGNAVRRCKLESDLSECEYGQLIHKYRSKRIRSLEIEKFLMNRMTERFPDATLFEQKPEMVGA